MPTEAWSLVQYRMPGPDACPQAGIWSDGIVHALPAVFAGMTSMGLLERWPEAAAALRTWQPSASQEVRGAVLVAPLTYPGKVLCAGANYYSHAAEMGTARPDPRVAPFFFLKPPTTTVIGPGEDIRYPTHPGTMLDWEVELAVVIGSRARNISAAHAGRHIAGYTAANDISARDRVKRADSVSPHFVYDWLAHKGQDGFCPLGPGIIPSWAMADPQDVRLRLSVNGTVKQDETTADMVVGIAELVAAASSLLTLEPGDVILTGTPAGVGMPRSEFLAPGDVVRIDIDGIGTLENKVTAS